MKALVVREAFGLDGVDHPRGEQITDPALVKKISESHAGHVLKVDVPDAPSSAK